jgi:hypothetical protein
MLARAAYGLIYLGIVAVAFLLPGWRDADWRIFAALRGAQPAWRGEIVLIDVPYSQTRAEYRGRLAALLEHFVKGTSGRPTLVVLDIAVDAATEEGLPRLAAVLRALARERVKLYAAVQPLDDSGYPTADYMSRHAQSIYRDLLDGHGHTLFQSSTPACSCTRPSSSCRISLRECRSRWTRWWCALRRTVSGAHRRRALNRS